MQGPRPNKLHDDLDALLDGRPVELTDELAPLVETADVLRIELAGYQLDPEVADRHLERILGDPGKVVQLPVRRPTGGWDVRRRIVAVALAAALVLAPATMASAAALPGQAMYPFKLAIEQVRIASVQWSPALEAGERTRVVDERISELERLVDLQMFNQVGPAVLALAKAVKAAEHAVAEAKEGATGAEAAKLTSRLASVQHQASTTVIMVSSRVQGAKLPTPDMKDAIQDAVEDAQQVLPPVTVPQTPPPGTPPVTTVSSPGSGPSESTSPPTTSPPTTSPPTTNPPTTNPPTTNPPTTNPPTTNPPTSDTAASADPPADQGRDAGGLGAGPGGAGTDTPLGVKGAPPPSTTP
jgi:hypothetical protein